MAAAVLAEPGIAPAAGRPAAHEAGPAGHSRASRTFGASGSFGASGTSGTSGSTPLLTQAAAELAADGAELAGTLAAQILGPLGADAVVLWILETDGALTLLGEQGLSGAEASHWRHLPPQLDCPAQRVAHGGADLWWQAGRDEADSAPVIGAPGGARVVLALRERTGEFLGVLEACWPGPPGLHRRGPAAPGRAGGWLRTGDRRPAGPR